MLFFILTPGIALTIPPKSNKSVVALVHALVFATVWHFTNKLVWHATEGFDVSPNITKLNKKGQLNLKITSDWASVKENLNKKIKDLISNNPNLTFITTELPCTINKTNKKCNEISELVLSDYDNNNIIKLVLTYSMTNSNDNQILNFLKTNKF
jgi:hypothetical protein